MILEIMLLIVDKDWIVDCLGCWIVMEDVEYHMSDVEEKEQHKKDATKKNKKMNGRQTTMPYPTKKEYWFGVRSIFLSLAKLDSLLNHLILIDESKKSKTKATQFEIHNPQSQSSINGKTLLYISSSNFEYKRSE